MDVMNKIMSFVIGMIAIMLFLAGIAYKDFPYSKYAIILSLVLLGIALFLRIMAIGSD